MVSIQEKIFSKHTPSLYCKPIGHLLGTTPEGEPTFLNAVAEYGAEGQTKKLE